jgi:glutathione synthase/RimK-type ligase-like ATP-grasp enzyme
LKRVGFITCRDLPALTADDRLAFAPLLDLGIEAAPAVWDSDADWKSFDSIVLRSCWDYHYRPEMFAGWLDHIERLGLAIWNPAQLIRWNMDKRYLGDLRQAGANIPRTVFVENGASLLTVLEENGMEQAVIKPAISATARRTWRTWVHTAREDQSRLDEILSESAAVVQEFVEEVVTRGEWSLVFFGGYSHAVLKRAAKNDFRVQSEFGGTSEAMTPPPHIIRQAEEILRLIDSPIVYARVDGVERDGRFTLLELELIEPELFLRLDPRAPCRFAQAIAAAV